MQAADDSGLNPTVIGFTPIYLLTSLISPSISK